MVEVLYVSWSEAIDLCYELTRNIAVSGFKPDAIVAVLRGGAIPALILSDVLAVDEFYSIRVRHWGIARELFVNPVVEQIPQEKLEGKRVLVVDEVVDTGKSLVRAVSELSRLKPAEVKTAVLHVKPTSLVQPDYYAKKLDRWVWVFYPWSLVETLTSLALREIEGKPTSRRELLEYAVRVGERLGVEPSRLNVLKGIISVIAG